MSQVLEMLISAPETINPAVALHQRMLDMEEAGVLTASKLLVMSGEIEKTLKLAEGESRFVKASLEALKEAFPVASSSVPEGF